MRVHGSIDGSKGGGNDIQVLRHSFASTSLLESEILVAALERARCSGAIAIDGANRTRPHADHDKRFNDTRVYDCTLLEDVERVAA